MIRNNGFSHKPYIHEKNMTDGLKLKPSFSHLWTKTLSSPGQQLGRHYIATKLHKPMKKTTLIG
uniref:Uncharacterized protein n=1 Tax=Arundo donax TaxID=35708 RepID=A0A0A9HCN7_ARUDO